MSTDPAADPSPSPDTIPARSGPLLQERDAEHAAVDPTRHGHPAELWLADDQVRMRFPLDGQTLPPLLARLNAVYDALPADDLAAALDEPTPDDPAGEEDSRGVMRTIGEAGWRATGWRQSGQLLARLSRRQQIILYVTIILFVTALLLLSR